MTAAKNEAPTIHLVALDDGSGNIAVVYQDAEGNRKETVQPSVVERGAILGVSGNGPRVWGIGEHRYTVRSSTSAQLSTLEPDYQISDANLALVADTLIEAGLGDSVIAVGCTLPANQFYNRGDERSPIAKDRIKAKDDNLKRQVINEYGAQQAPQIVHVIVYPEAIPAYFYASDPSRVDATPGAVWSPKQTSLVVDLGEFTDDLAIIHNDDVVTFATHENGVHKMVEHFHTLLIREAATLGIKEAKSIPAVDLKTIIERGYTGSDVDHPAVIAKRKDVRHLVEEAARHLGELVKADIDKLTRGRQIDRLIFVGGGANWLGHIAQEWHDVVDIPQDPHLAICRGVHLLLQSQRESILKQAHAALAKREATKETTQ